jgi:hypothetical protein
MEKQKKKSITNSECVSVTLVIEQANLMRRIILSSVACQDTLYYSALSYKRHDFREKLLNLKYVL